MKCVLWELLECRRHGQVLRQCLPSHVLPLLLDRNHTHSHCIQGLLDLWPPPVRPGACARTDLITMIEMWFKQLISSLLVSNHLQRALLLVFRWISGDSGAAESGPCPRLSSSVTVLPLSRIPACSNPFTISAFWPHGAPWPNLVDAPSISILRHIFTHASRASLFPSV